MNKICTSIEQSQKLIELGIDTSTADMCWCSRKLQWGEINETIIAYPMLHNQEKSVYFKYSPAWSLTSLFSMLPKSAYLEKGSSTELCRVNLPVELKCSDWYLEPIDAVFEMVCMLKKEEYI